jgi:signal peptidase I
VAITSKDPWLAVNFSMFFPGMGQFYARKRVRGLIFLLGQIGIIAIALWSIFSPQGNPIVGFFYLCLALGVYLINILDAHLNVYQQQGNPALERIPRQQKNPWFAVFVSRLLPGLGQLYNNQSLIGIFFLSSTLMLLQLKNFFPSLLIVPPFLAAIATYHAYVTFPQRTKLRRQSLIAAIVGIIFIWGLISSYFPQWIAQKIQLFDIPSASMQPTLQIGDRVFVSSASYYLPHPGDIIVFSPTENMKALDEETAQQPDVYFIKRVIGVAGQTVQIKEGVVYLDNIPLKEKYIAQSPNYQWGPEIIPEDNYFVLGDNRNNSFDSHVWGFLPKDYLVGPAYKIVWPPARVKEL